jgi:hypothetical protein
MLFVYRDNLWAPLAGFGAARRLSDGDVARREFVCQLLLSLLLLLLLLSFQSELAGQLGAGASRSSRPAGRERADEPPAGAQATGSGSSPIEMKDK